MFIGDSNGKARTARRHIVGADKISRFLFGLVEVYGVDRISFGEMVLVNGELGVHIPHQPADGARWEITRRVTTFEVADGRVTRIYDIANPDKLTRLSR